MTIPADELVVFDVYVDYEERAASPQTALGRGACRETSECDYSRTKEQARIATVVVDPENVPQAAAVKRWRAAHEAATKSYRDLVGRFMRGTSDAALVKRWLVEWLASHPLRHHGFVRERIEHAETNLLDVATQRQLLFWLGLDLRESLLSSTCHRCEALAGVPLARVWLRRTRSTSGVVCRVLFVDAGPPYRRPLGPAGWPASDGQLNAAEILGRSKEEARAVLADAGVVVTWRENAEYPDFAALDAVVPSVPEIPLGQPVTVDLLRTPEMRAAQVWTVGAA
jgi:hypothetical protein